MQETVENCDIVAEATTPRPLLSTDEPICRTGETACSDRCAPSSFLFFLISSPTGVSPNKMSRMFRSFDDASPNLATNLYILEHESLYNVTINSTAESCYPLHMSWSNWKILYRGTLTQCRKNIEGTFKKNNLTIQNIFYRKEANSLFWPYLNLAFEYLRDLTYNMSYTKSTHFLSVKT